MEHNWDSDALSIKASFPFLHSIFYTLGHLHLLWIGSFVQHLTRGYDDREVMAVTVYLLSGNRASVVVSLFSLPIALVSVMGSVEQQGLL